MEDDVKLPDQVKKQQENADRLWKEQHGKTDEPTTPEPELKPEPEPEPEPDYVDETPEPEPEPEPTPEPEPEPPATDFEHKFNVLQGKYDAEIPRLSQENRQLRDQTIELGSIIGRLQTEIEKLKGASDEPAQAVKGDIYQFLTDEEVEEVESSIDPGILAKVVQGMIKTQIAPFEQSLTSVRDTQYQTAEDRFWDKVNTTLPKWQEVNNNPAFGDWLGTKAPYTNRTRQQVLTDAQKSLNAETVVEIFNDFLRSSDSGHGATPAQGGQPVAAKPTGKKPRIAPAKGVGASSKPAEGRIWTRKEIKDYYADVQRGKFRGKEKEQKRLEADIWKAQREGRVR